MIEIMNAIVSDVYVDVIVMVVINVIERADNMICDNVTVDYVDVCGVCDDVVMCVLCWYC